MQMATTSGVLAPSYTVGKGPQTLLLVDVAYGVSPCTRTSMIETTTRHPIGTLLPPRRSEDRDTDLVRCHGSPLRVPIWLQVVLLCHRAGKEDGVRRNGRPIIEPTHVQSAGRGLQGHTLYPSPGAVQPMNAREWVRSRRLPCTRRMYEGIGCSIILRTGGLRLVRCRTDQEDAMVI